MKKVTGAQLLGRQLDGILTYDKRLVKAARNVGIKILNVDG